MDFFNKLGKKASETYQFTKEKATNLSEELKLRGKISEKNDKIEEIYTEIGKIVYAEMKAGTDLMKEDLAGKCDEISTLSDEIAKLEADILNIKKIKKCVSCGAELEKNADFCSKCGKEQPKIEEESVEIKEEPEGVKEAEVVEVKDVEQSVEVEVTIEEKEDNKEGEVQEESKDNDDE